MPAGPRLAIFVHVLDAENDYMTGQDGLGVDPYTLEPGDRFVHLHRLVLPVEARQTGYKIRLGLYDPHTGERWRTDQGADGVLVFTFDGDGQ